MSLLGDALYSGPALKRPRAGALLTLPGEHQFRGSRLLQGCPQHTPDTEAPLLSSHLEYLCYAVREPVGATFSHVWRYLSRPIGEELKRQLSSLPQCSQAVS